MAKSPRTYIPAAGHDWWLPLYDPISKLLGLDAARRALLEQAAIRPNHRVLDIGCGTGSLIMLIKRLHPDLDVVGLDPDPKALARARRKAERAAVSIKFQQAFSDELPYPDASFDRVFSSFMFHHLAPDEKEQTLGEIRRVLKPGGSLHMLDFGGPDSNPHGFFARFLHFGHRLKDNFGGRILTFMSQAGLENPKEVNHRTTLFGPIAYYRASAPTAKAGEKRSYEKVCHRLQ
ncbi:MAG: methyltransferase domain-containing protein [Deltaproteobacteria bacterium]|nr:methyltransferase domain-containing protein [Deltaproteobacteria bacterium]